MQLMAVEMMMMMIIIMKVMCVCYDDDGAQKHGLKNQHGDNIHIYAHYACMKQKRFAYLHWTCRAAET